MAKTLYYVFSTDDRDYCPDLIETFTNKAKALAFAKSLAKLRRAKNGLRESEGSRERDYTRYAVATSCELITPDPALPWMQRLDRDALIAYRL